MKYIFLLLLGTILWLPAMAGNLQFHLRSDHGDGCDTCNERNLGIGYRGEGRIGPMLGYYPNSCHRDSFYVGANARLGAGFSTSALGLTGYTKCIDTEFLFGEMAVVPTVHWRVLYNSRVSPLITWVPFDHGGAALLSIDFRY